MSIQLSNLPNVSKEYITNLVIAFGPVAEVKIRQTGTKGTVAEVVFDDPEDGEEAVKNMDYSEIEGKVIRATVRGK